MYQHQLTETIEWLQQCDSFTKQHHEELECIDTQITKIVLAADKACSPPNPAPWLPALNQAYLQHCLWSITLTVHCNQHKWKKSLPLYEPSLPLPEDEQEHCQSILPNLCHAQKQFCKAKKEAEELHKKHLEALLNEAWAANQWKTSKTLTYLICPEQNCKCYAAYCQHTKPKSSSGVAFLTTTTDPNQPPTMILDPDDMNGTLLK